MNQIRIKMKPARQAAESRPARDTYVALADQFLQENEYLPARGDQSWRERAALRIAGGYEAGDGDEVAFAAPEELVPEPAIDGKGRGGILVGLFMVCVIVPVIAVLTAPDILTADFWRQPRAANVMPTSNAPPTRTTSIAAPLRASLANRPEPEQTAAGVPPAQPLPAMDQKLDTEPAAIAASEAVPVPTPRPAERIASAPDNRAPGALRTLVVGTDGTLSYEYFPSGTHTAEPDNAQNSDGGGFYAKVAGPDGTLQERYFPSKPSQ